MELVTLNYWQGILKKDVPIQNYSCYVLIFAKRVLNIEGKSVNIVPRNRKFILGSELLVISYSPCLCNHQIRTSGELM